MKFSLKRNDNIPKLSWHLQVVKGKTIAFLEHGSDVEVSEFYFFEGAWDGNLEELKFDESIFFLGTGGKCIEDRIKLATPNHTLERIYCIQILETLHFSNSLPFILQRTNSDTDKSFYHYEEYFSSILKGLKQYRKEIPLANARSLRLFYSCNILINDNLNIDIEEKNTSSDFGNFAYYFKTIDEYLSRFVKNINSKYRSTNYKLVTTISNGYDAAACSVMAKRHGCDIAVTFNQPKKYEDDCGESIAKNLGFKEIIKRNANAYLHNDQLLETQYICSGELGTGIVFSAFDDIFQNSVVFFGERGDKIWAKNWPSVNNHYFFDNEIYAGTSLIESRLRLGYILMPLPLYGADNWQSINKISNSEEMTPYSIGGDYDRPIPRRIIEEAGVSRNMFGIKKIGAGFNYRYDSKQRLAGRMSKKTYDTFRLNYKSAMPLRRIASYLKFLKKSSPHYINFITSKLGIPIRFKTSTNHFTSNPLTPLDLFNWSIDVMKTHYR